MAEKRNEKNRKILAQTIKKMVKEKEAAPPPVLTSLDDAEETVMLLTEALTYLRQYEGGNPLLRTLASKAKSDPRWVPTDRQAIQVHRIAHLINRKSRSDPLEVSQSAVLSERVRIMDDAHLPDSLADPEEHGL